MTRLRKIVPFIFYFVYFLVIFFPIFSENALPGNTDTLYNLAIFKDYWNRIVAFITNESIGNSLYPSEMVQKYAELYFGQAFLYLFYFGIFQDDILSYYLFLTTLYALNGLGMFLFAFRFLNRKIPSLVAGFIFSSSAFSFSQIELLNGIPYFFFFLSIVKFLDYTSQPLHYKNLVFSAIYAACQFYFSTYVFLYLLVFFVVLSIYHGKIWLQKQRILALFLSILVGLFLIFPYLYFADFGLAVIDSFNPLNYNSLPKFSLHFSDLWRHLPNNYIYNIPQPPIVNETVRNINFAFLGLGFWCFFFLSVYSLPFKTIRFLLIFLFVALFFSFGPTIQLLNFTILNPFEFLYSKVGLHSLFRIPARAFSLVIIAGSLTISFYLNRFPKSKRIQLSVALCCLFFLENVPSRLNLYSVKQFLPPDELIDFFSTKEHHSDLVIAILPSSIFTGKGYNKYERSEFSREYAYMYWQTFFKVNLVNGMCGFCPPSRMEFNELSSKGLGVQVAKKYKLDYLILNTESTYWLEGEQLDLMELPNKQPIPVGKFLIYEIR